MKEWDSPSSSFTVIDRSLCTWSDSQQSKLESKSVLSFAGFWRSKRTVFELHFSVYLLSMSLYMSLCLSVSDLLVVKNRMSEEWRGAAPQWWPLTRHASISSVGIGWLPGRFYTAGNALAGKLRSLCLEQASGNAFAESFIQFIKFYFLPLRFWRLRCVYILPVVA